MSRRSQKRNADARRRSHRTDGQARTSSRVRECSVRQRTAIEQHVARYLAPATQVLHEIQSELVHVDVHVVPPGHERPFWFLFTTGMSALPMRVPHGFDLVPHAELSLMLPDWWRVDRELWSREPKWFWPIREMVSLARYPHRHRTWFGDGHTITSNPPRPLDKSTRLAGMLLLPCWLDEDDCPTINAEVPTELFSLWPVYPDELDYKVAHGAGALIERLDAAGVSAILDPQRKSVGAAPWGTDLRIH